jgi:Flp pilus assembly protein TadD
MRRPEDPRLEAQVAETLIRLGRGHEAVAGLERALQRLGGCAELWYQLGAAQLAIGQPESAVASYRACLLVGPGPAPTLNNLGTALLQSGRPDEAISCFEAALTAAPGYVRPLVNLGKALREVGRLPEALVRLYEALTHAPENPGALVNLGDALTEGGEFAEAATVLERVVAGHPRLTEARVSLGHCCLRRGAIDVAIETLERAVEQDPAHSEARFLLGYTLFLVGTWRRAWPLFEHRHSRRSRPIALAAPAGLERWDGTLRPGTTLVLVAEQGLGDTLQFARYAQVLTAHGLHPVLHCQKSLVRLMELSGLFAAVAPLGAPPPPGATAWYPLMSLPARFETVPGTVPAAGGYLRVEPGRVTAWRTRLPAPATFRVGIAWQGNPLAERGELRGRSPPLAEFGQLAALPGVALVSLQKDAGVE